ncbi:MAG: hypothetical protein ACREM3_29665, partial [Candidatus Rokuibacteriota bacterium]
ARIDTIAGSAPALPSKGDVIVEIDESATRLTGEWKTDIGTSGTIVLTKDAVGQEPVEREALSRRDELKQTTQAAQGAPAAPDVPAPAQVSPPAPPPVLAPLRLDFRNVPVNPFRMQIDDLLGLIRIFSEAVERARQLELERIKTMQDPETQRRALASLPHPMAEMMAASGQIIISADLRSLSAAILPDDIKTVHLTSSLPQPAHSPSHNVVVRINNINGADSANVEGHIGVQGADATWVAGTFANVRDFFVARRVRRRWLHKTGTGQLLLYGVVFPLTLWTLYRLLPFLPTRFSDTPLLTFGLFLYALLAYYLAFDRLLRYARWVFPLYELESRNRHRFQRHRILLSAIIVGVVSGFLSDFVLGFLR